MNRKRTAPEEETVKANEAAQDAANECAACAEEDQIAQEMKRLTEESEKAAKERDEFLNLAQRVQADFDNYRRRNQNAREDAYNDGVRDTLLKFLPVLDNLERAASAQGEEGALKEGVLLVVKQLTGILTAAGVEEIPAQDCAFDPNVHNAVMQEAVEGCASGQVVGVLQKGYTHKGRVLRHCMVKVSE